MNATLPLSWLARWRPAGAPRPQSALDAPRVSISGEGPPLQAWAGALLLPRLLRRDRAALRPLLLLPGLGLAASAAEMQPLFEHYRVRRAVLVPDLGAFGAAAPRPSPGLMVQALLRCLAHLRRHGLGEPADVLATGLACEFAALAALARPAWFASLAFVSPSGLAAGSAEDAQRGWRGGRSHDRPLLRRLLAHPLAEPLHRLRHSPPLLRRHWRRALGLQAVDDGLVERAVQAARCPGARRTAAALAAGTLATRGIAAAYTRLEQPLWIAHGVRGAASRFEALATLGAAHGWNVDVFGTGALPQLEMPDYFVQRYQRFLDQAAAA